jgi:hypothetical protein
VIKLSSDLKEATNFDECISNKISLIADEEPDKKPDQRTAIAYNMCRKKFGISKASVLFLLERSQLLNEESLEQVKGSMEKGMESKDWIEFAALMKNQGCKHKEISNRVNKSESWIKKYVNPILPEVTPPVQLSKSSDTINGLKPGLPIHTILKFTVTEIKKSNRTFGGWGSAEVLDSQDEVVSIEGLEAIMPTYMKRGSPIMFGHSNRHVGNVFKYQIKDKLVKGEYIPALWLEGRIFSDYKIDDMAWEAIQYAYSAGLPVLSLGATPLGHPEVQCNDTACFKKYNEFQLYEFTITEQQIGSIGANPEATMEVVLSKSIEGSKVNETQKQAVREQLAQLEKASALPQNDLELVNLMLGTCKSCQEEFQKLLSEGYTEEQAKASLLKELVENMSDPKDEKTPKDEKNPSENPDTTEKEFTAAINKSIAGPVLKEVADLAAALTKIDARLDNIEQAVTKNTANIGNTNAAFVEGSTIKADDAQKTEEASKDNTADASKQPAQLTFSKDFEKQMESYMKDKGYTKIAETPAPSTTEARDLTKRDVTNSPANQSKMPSSEEMSEALVGWKHGRVSDLSQKYGYGR